MEKGRTGRGRTKWNWTGPTQAATEIPDGTGDQDRSWVHLLLFFNSFYSSLMPVLFLSDCLFSAEHNDM